MSNFLPFQGPIFNYFKENYDSLKEEFFKYGLNFDHEKPNYPFKDKKNLYSGNIKVIPFKLTWFLLDKYERDLAGWHDNDIYKFPFKKKFPKLFLEMKTWSNLLLTFEDSIEQCFFNVAHPGALLQYHKGVSNHCYRAHICFQNNPGFIFDIGGEKRAWSEGIENSFMFDDGNILHGVLYNHHEDTTPRIVCILDIRKSAF